MFGLPRKHTYTYIHTSTASSRMTRHHRCSWAPAAPLRFILSSSSVACSQQTIRIRLPRPHSMHLEAIRPQPWPLYLQQDVSLWVSQHLWSPDAKLNTVKRQPTARSANHFSENLVAAPHWLFRKLLRTSSRLSMKEIIVDYLWKMVTTAKNKYFLA